MLLHNLLKVKGAQLLVQAETYANLRPVFPSERGSRPCPLWYPVSGNFPAMPPLFVTFEGLDGSGKSTHLRRVSAWLVERGVPHVVTHEPGGTPLGDDLRALFLDPKRGAMDG